MRKFTNFLFSLVFLFSLGTSHVIAEGGVGSVTSGGGSGGGALGSGTAGPKPEDPAPTSNTSSGSDSGSTSSTSTTSTSSGSANTSTTSGSTSTTTSTSTSSSSGSSGSSGGTTTETETASADTSTGDNEESGGSEPPPPPPAGLLTVTIGESSSTSYKHTVSTIEIDEAGGEIVINGSGFNTGPNIMVFDSFDNGGVTGADIPLLNSNNPACSTDVFGLAVNESPGPTIGCWNATGGTNPVYHDLAHSGTHSMLGWGGADTANVADRVRMIRKQFPDSTEVFLSFWTHIPPGDIYPGRWGSTTPVPEVFPNDSAWKVAWFTQDGGYDNYFANLCTPTMILGNAYIAGNSNNLGAYGNEGSFWSRTNFTRMATWLRGNPADLLGDGELIFQTMSLNKGFRQASNQNIPIFSDNGPGPNGAPSDKYFNGLNIPGWLRWAGLNGADGTRTEEVLYDDIYLAVGPNSVSRVELGNAPTYLGNTQLKIQLPVTWEDDKIKISIANLNGMDVNDSYLYIVDNDGNFNPNGYPLQ